ncbi:hypothetical protein D9M71_656990 [compost metagenome]
MAGDGRLGDDLAIPHPRQQLVAAHHPVAVDDQLQQQVEHLRADGHGLPALGQLPALLVEHKVVKLEWHVMSLARLRLRVRGDCSLVWADDKAAFRWLHMLGRVLNSLDGKPSLPEGKSSQRARTLHRLRRMLEP